jgi:hypothetical protein
VQVSGVHWQRPSMHWLFGRQAGWAPHWHCPLMHRSALAVSQTPLPQVKEPASMSMGSSHMPLMQLMPSGHATHASPNAPHRDGESPDSQMPALVQQPRQLWEQLLFGGGGCFEQAHDPHSTAMATQARTAFVLLHRAPHSV